MRPIHKIAQEITNHKTFKVFILFLIFLSAVLAGIETYLDSAGRHRLILLFLDNFIVYCFAAEILLKILAMGKKPLRFFSDPWNVFDFIIVAICLIPAVDTHFVAVIRIARVLRVLRMVNYLSETATADRCPVKEHTFHGICGYAFSNVILYLFDNRGVYFRGE